MLEKRIAFLSEILGKYDIEYLEKKYREKELRHVQESLEKARYSDKMAKRMIAEAKRKKISKSKKLYIQSLLSRNKNFDPAIYKVSIKTQLTEFFNSPDLRFSDGDKINKIFFEHDFDPKAISANVYKSQSGKKADNEFIRLKTKIDFAPIWGFIEENKFDTMSESLGDIDVEDEEYPQIFVELFLLRSYMLVKEILNTEPLEDVIPIDLIDENFKILIGEHDNRIFEIFKR